MYVVLISNHLIYLFKCEDDVPGVVAGVVWVGNPWSVCFDPRPRLSRTKTNRRTGTAFTLLLFNVEVMVL